MATIVTRAGKGAALTHQEVDANFTGLNTELGQKEVASNKGVANGYASLDAAGKVPSAQLPSYVDDVVEVANFASLPGTGETGKIYVTIDANKTYRWTGSTYIEISASPGSTDSLAEGSTNLYFTQARARASISASGSLSYNSSTGVMSFSDAVTSVAGRTGAVTLTSSDVGLGNVENKSSATIRGEITSGNVTTALGFTPYNSTNPSGYITSSALSSYLPLIGGTLSGALSWSGGTSINDYTGTYGSLQITGGNGSFDGVVFPTYTNTPTVMFDNAGGGLYYQGNSVWGFYYSRANGTLHVGSSSTNQVLHAGNYNSYAMAGAGYSANQNLSTTSSPTFQVLSVTSDLQLTRSDTTPALLFPNQNGLRWIYNGGGNYWQTTVSAVSGGGNLALNGNAILHAGNYNSYALPLSGGTLTGTVYTHGTSSALATSDYRRIMHPGGATYVTQASTVTGAIKIKMPLLGSAMMMMATVRVYEYSTGRSFELVYGGHRDGVNWYNEFCYMVGDENRGDINVRFGIDGTSDCVWIGETNTSWAYPQVWVTDVQIGYAGYSASWTTGWSVSFVTSFDTVNRGPRTAYRRLTSSNYTSYSPSLTGTGASGTWGINITGNAGTVSSITSGQVTTALGYTPYNSTNPSGYITSSALSSYLPLAGGTMTGDLRINSDWGAGSFNEQLIIYGTYPSMTFRSTQSDTGWLVHTQGDGGLTYYSIAGASTNNWTQRMTLLTNGELRRGGASGDLYIHSGNYSSYSPTLTGSGASGTWGISISGSAETLDGLDSSRFIRRVRNRIHADDGTSMDQLDGSVEHGFNYGTSSGVQGPYITFGGLFGEGNYQGQINASYQDSSVWRVRTRNNDTGVWNAWRTLLNESNYSSYALPLSGGTITGTVSINGGGSQPLNLTTSSSSPWGFGLTRSDAGISSKIFLHNGSGSWAWVYEHNPVFYNGGAYSPFLHSGNYNSYSPSLTGGGASGTWAINITGSAGSASLATDADRLRTYDHRIKAPNSDAAGRAVFGFTSWANNNTAPWADYLHLRSYTDSSGGADNLVMFRKDAIGMRIWQQSFGSGSAYSNYVDVLHSSNYSSYALPLSGGVLSGALRATNITAGGGTNTDTSFGVNGSAHFAPSGTFVYWGGSIGTLNSWSSREYSNSGIHQLNVSRWILDRFGYGSQPLIDAYNGGIDLGQYTTIASGARVNGGIRQGANVARPLAEWSASGSSTGMVYIEMPGSTSNYGMIHAVIDVYEYNGNAAATIIVGGHNWVSSWYNVSANVIGSTNKEVRLAVRNGKFVICLGTASSTWEYGTVILRKIHNATFYNNIMDMGAQFVIAQTTSEGLSGSTGDLRALRTPASFNAGGAITQAGNQVLHAGNYGSYALPLSGGTMTGTIYSNASSLIIGQQGGSIRGYLYNDSAGIGFLTSSGSWAAYVPLGTNNWQVNGSITASGNVTAYSDERVKANWRKLDDGFLVNLANVKSGIYDRTDIEITQVGVSAQSLRDVLPHAVIEADDGDLSVAYGNAAMVSAVELAKELVALRNKVAALEARIH